MQTHLTLRTLAGDERPNKDVQALFSTQPDGKALLFIHGFTGSPINTWADFHELLLECPKCASRDVYFYGYDGLRAEMNSSAAIFREFLDRMLSHTDALLAANLPTAAQRAAGFSYQELIVVAHSLGAVIARRALLDATRANQAWAPKIKLVLYAPAHKGASVADLALESASTIPFLRLFGIGARFHSPLIDELKSESRSLKKLLADFEAARQGGANSHLIATRVILAELERIVVNDSFGEDPAPVAIPGTTHTTVCKPTRTSRHALVHLESCL
ncbi:MAG TPA: alpha/beta hydrolase [Verrucomicrobiae bacterium]|nr:alpha/beta hydrolase [Verrucomicrobiae bacterium]